MTACPSDETLGALVHRALGVHEAAVVTSHLDNCDACRELVVEAVRAGVVVGVAPTFPRGTPSLPATRSAPADDIGKRLGRYELRGVLGTGGMGRVYDAYDGELDRALALKVMRPELTRGSGVLAERLVRESRIMAKVVHPSVITVYDVGHVDDSVFIAMERIRGETLGAYVTRVKPSWRVALDLFERAGQGLAAAHDAGIVHRDFKPDNVLVELDGDRVRRVVVTDFGVARAVVDETIDLRSDPGTSGQSKLTTTGAAIGTPAYMAPEQLDGDRVDVRADVFAFAVSLWEALFGQRPFRGLTVAEIRIAMMEPPKAPRGVPADIVRALERGLAIEPSERWSDMHALLRALRRRRTRTWIGLAVVLVAVLVAGAVVTTRALADAPIDPCARALEPLDRAVAQPRLSALRAQLGRTVMWSVDYAAAKWRTVHAATCSDETPQSATVAACLDARRIEIAGFLDDVAAEGPAGADKLVAIIDDPKLCEHPSPGNLMSKMPEDPALRRRVTALRRRGFEGEAMRDRTEFAKAEAVAKQLVVDAKDVWAPVYAEALYLLGTTQSLGGDAKQGSATLRDAAAVAERAHHDYIAANAWIQLVLSSMNDEGSAQHAVEYATYAEAAVDRLGRPSSVATLFDYAKGMALVAADKPAEGEAALREALHFAETEQPTYLSTVIQGLGYLYEAQARYPDAIAAYRRALSVDTNRGTPVESTFRSQLAQNLSMAGFDREAEVEARKAVEIDDRVLPADNTDRAGAHAELAQVLEGRGKFDEALAEIRIAKAAYTKTSSERNERWGEASIIEAAVLADLQRFREAETMFARACDVIAFSTGGNTSSDAECWTSEAAALDGLGNHQGAFALADKSIAVLEKSYGPDHPHVAMAYAIRGEYRGEMGDHANAIADLQHALDVIAKSSSDPGHTADITYHFGRELWTRDRARGRAIVELANAWFETSSGGWRRNLPEIHAWLASHR